MVAPLAALFPIARWPALAYFDSYSSARNVHTCEAEFKPTSDNFACVVYGVAYFASYSSACNVHTCDAEF